MVQDLTVRLVENDEDLLDIIPLKQADDEIYLKRPVTEDEALEKLISLRNHLYDLWIARLKSQVIGYASGIVQGIGFPKEERLESKEIYRGEGIYVAPEFRNQGIGSALKKAQIELAKALGCDEIMATISPENLSSIRMQEKTGANITFQKPYYISKLKLR